VGASPACVRVFGPLAWPPVGARVGLRSVRRERFSLPRS
jgi:hypothetical protein